jgi:integrase
MRVNLTERRIAALAPDPEGRRRPELRDAMVPGLIVRIAARRKVFALHARFPGAKHPTRRVLGEVGTVTLDAPRDTAREWLAQVRKGIDPAAEARRRQDEERRARAAARVADECRFERVADDYLKRKVKGQRRAREAERIVRNVLVIAWGDRPISDITRRDVVRLVEVINDRPAPIYAQLVFSHARSLFNWAINRGIYGLEHSPCDRVKVGDLVSRRKQPRQRVLSDDEVRCLWKASGRLGYPWGPLFRFILLTGLRKTEAAGARWKEFDLERKVFSVPPERFKSNAAHLVPLSGDALVIIAALPRFRRGDYVFSFSFGETPALVLHSAKRRLDSLMLRYLRALARLRGEDPAAVALEPWQTHDLRRVVRSKLAALEVNDTVAELVIGHAKRGLQRVYDQHRYEPQMRRALEAWASELSRIVAPTRGQRGDAAREGGVKNEEAGAEGLAAPRRISPQHRLRDRPKIQRQPSRSIGRPVGCLPRLRRSCDRRATGACVHGAALGQADAARTIMCNRRAG